jgi:hypothetical protein
MSSYATGGFSGRAMVHGASYVQIIKVSVMLYSQHFQLAQPMDCGLVHACQSVVVELPAKRRRPKSVPRNQDTKSYLHKYHNKIL